MKKTFLCVLALLLALSCFVGCDNPVNPSVNNGGTSNGNQNNETTDENTDWWIGTWKSPVTTTTNPTTNKEMNFYVLIEIKYNKYAGKNEESKTFKLSYIDNNTNIIYNLDGTVSTKEYTTEGIWKYRVIDDKFDYSNILFTTNKGEKVFEGGLHLDYNKKQLYWNNYETSQLDYYTKIK